MRQPKLLIIGNVSKSGKNKLNKFTDCIYSKYGNDYDLVITLDNEIPPETTKPVIKMLNEDQLLSSLEELVEIFIKNIIKKDETLISIFTSSYKSKHRIYRPLNSLLNQTYKNWEWIIVDDTCEDDNWQLLTKVKSKDPNRIRIYRSDKNSGKIGEMKQFASNLARGTIVVELDHDDDIVPETLQWIKEAFDSYPDCGFVYSDFSEIYEENGENFSYGDNFRYGYAGYRKELYKEKWINVCSSCNINYHTMTYITGVPNHIRCWRKSTLQEIGGYNHNLHVADDYEILLRTFFHTKMLRIPRLCYIQYRNAGGNNFTFIRNEDIQKLTRNLSKVYDNQIRKRCMEFNCYEFEEPIVDYNYTHKHHNHFNEIYRPNKDLISIVISTYNRPELLKKAIKSVFEQTYKNYELIIVGDKCPILDKFMEKNKDNRIKWWNLGENMNDGGAGPKNYALKYICEGNFIAYLDDDNYWENNHLESLFKLFDDDTQYTFSSFVSGEYKIKFKEPKKYRIDTSCVLHRRELLEKYGYWKKQQDVGYANDWDLFSRWNNEKWKASELFTLNYNNNDSVQNIKLIYEYYNDQD